MAGLRYFEDACTLKITQTLHLSTLPQQLLNRIFSTDEKILIFDVLPGIIGGEFDVGG